MIVNRISTGIPNSLKSKHSLKRSSNVNIQNLQEPIVDCYRKTAKSVLPLKKMPIVKVGNESNSENMRNVFAAYISKLEITDSVWAPWSFNK